MKILSVENGSGVGGSHVQLYYLLRALRARGIETVVSLPEPHPWYSRFAECAEVIFERNGRPGQADVIRASSLLMKKNPSPAAWKNSAAWRALSFYRYYLTGHRRGVEEWRTLIDSIAPDVVHANNSLPINFPVIEAALSLGRPVVCHVRGLQQIRAPHRSLFRKVTASIAISEVIRRHCVEGGAPPDRIVRIYDGLDLKDYPFREPCIDVPPDGGRVLFVGRLIGWKGAPVLLEALSLLSRTRPNIRCTIGGDGTARSDWEADVRARGLESVVRFTGFVSDVVSLYHDADVLVHTSIAPEPLGRVILEGMATGTPVVASAHGASPELIDDGRSGWLSTPGSGAELAACIETALSAGPARADVARRARARLEREFTFDATVEGCLDVFQKIMDRGWGGD